MIGGRTGQGTRIFRLEGGPETARGCRHVSGEAEYNVIMSRVSNRPAMMDEYTR